jgi:hypothetical protein
VLLSWSIFPHDARTPGTQLGQHSGQTRTCSDAQALAGRDVACAGRRAELAVLARDVPRCRWLPEGSANDYLQSPTQRRGQQRPPLNMIRKITHASRRKFWRSGQIADRPCR